MSDMTCRYCGARIVWAEGRGWLTVSDSRVVWNTESCVARPTTKGGPEAGHALLEEEPPVPTPDPYVPTTEEVREGYVAHRRREEQTSWNNIYRGEFDRWLAGVRADQAEKLIHEFDQENFSHYSDGTEGHYLQRHQRLAVQRRIRAVALTPTTEEKPRPVRVCIDLGAGSSVTGFSVDYDDDVTILGIVTAQSFAAPGVYQLPLERLES